MKARGFEVLMAAVNPNADVLGFARQYQTSFPVGTANYEQARGFLQLSVMRQAYVPWFTLIDRKGDIRLVAFGNEVLFTNEDANIRNEVGKLLAEKGPAGPMLPPKKAGGKK